MQYDLIIRNGDVVDGTGLPRFRADVGIRHGRIATIGRVTGRAQAEIDAEGHAVTPGFIDGHTHMDAQILWDPLGTCSVWHGVTSVVMGNCGFTLAPARANARGLVVRNLERAEDISADAMAAGITWTWETFPEYFDTLDRLPKGINYSGYVGHSALRTWAMGERAFEDNANEDDLAAMARELRDAMRAGAIGFSTSRTPNHETADDRPVASRLGTWQEVQALVGVMGELGAGIFEIANENAARVRDPEVRNEYFGRLKALAVQSGRPVTFGIIAARPDGADWQGLLNLLDETGQAGGRMIGQAHAREFSVVLSFKTRMPFDALPEWKEIRERPLDEQRRALADPETRAWLVKAANEGEYARAIGAETRAPNYDDIKVVDSPLPPWRSVNEVAAERQMDPVELIIDLAVKSDFQQLFFQVIANHDPEAQLAIMRHPRTVTTFSDSGAHVSQLMDSSIQTHLLGYWTRQKQAFTLEEAVRMLTLEPASAWGFHDRGLLREGMAADLNVLDPATIAPAMPEVVWDLPGGARRLVQKSTGIKATVVNGEVLTRDGEHTGAMPGQLLRGPLARH